MKLGRILRRSVRWLVYLALAAVCYLLQACVFSRMPILGAGPLILPVAVACVALWEGADRGALFGLLAGVLCDAAMGRPAVMYTLLLTALGYDAEATGMLGSGWEANVVSLANVELLYAGIPGFDR